jgi:hypothetical protein
MKSRYDGAPGKEAAIASVRHKRLESEHSAKNAFVKKHQAESSKMAGKSPELKQDCMKFNAQMMNTGEHAQMLAKKLTAGIDSKAFPVDGDGNDS